MYNKHKKSKKVQIIPYMTYYMKNKHRIRHIYAIIYNINNEFMKIYGNERMIYVVEGLEYEEILEKSPFGYALYKIFLNEDGDISDLEYLEMNDTFEKITGKKLPIPGDAGK